MRGGGKLKVKGHNVSCRIKINLITLTVAPPPVNVIHASCVSHAHAAETGADE